MTPIRWVLSQMSTGRATAVAFIVFMLGYGYLSLSLEKTIEVDVVGPDTFPKLLTVLGLILGVIMFARSSPAAPGASAESPIRIDGLFREIFALSPLLLLLGYVLVLDTAGFPLATVGLLVVLFKSLGQRTWRGAGLIALISTVVVFVFFVHVVDIPLPLGTVFTETLGWFES